MHPEDCVCVVESIALAYDYLLIVVEEKAVCWLKSIAKGREYLFI